MDGTFYNSGYEARIGEWSVSAKWHRKQRVDHQHPELKSPVFVDNMTYVRKRRAMDSRQILNR